MESIYIQPTGRKDEAFRMYNPREGVEVKAVDWAKEFRNGYEV